MRFGFSCDIWGVFARFCTVGAEMEHFFKICYDVKLVAFELALLFSFMLFLWRAARQEWKRHRRRCRGSRKTSRPPLRPQRGP